MIKKSLICITCIFVFVCNICFASNFNMSYIYGSNTNVSISNVIATKNSLNEVSPSYFDLNADGSLHLTNALDVSFIKKMHELNIKVVPFLSNHWDRELGKIALSNRENLANEILKVIEEYNLDGVNVDIENVTEIDKDNYTDLVRLLREKLPSNKSVSVAVAANPKSWQTGWHGSYDYKELAKYADYLMIMAYDEHYQGDTPGSVSSYEFVENSIKYALQYVPKDKIVVGLAFFGRYWNSETGEGGRGVNNRLINEILQDYNSVGIYDEDTRTMKAIITVSEQQAQNDKYIFSAGTYEFWYENDDTLKEKIDLVNKYDLKGTGSWSLGQEIPTLWDNYLKWLHSGDVQIAVEPIESKENKVVSLFIDVEKDRWSNDQIMYVKNQELMIGRTKNEFVPEEYLTRAEAVTIINRLLKKIDRDMKIRDMSINITDIYNHWAYNDIKECIKNGILNGYPDNTFKPNNYISREEIAKIIENVDLQISKIGTEIPFLDVDNTSWSYSSIINIVKMKIMMGYKDNLFKPKNNITREEMATVIYNICDKLGID